MTDRGSATRVHIAEIDFEEFYRPTFPDEASSRRFTGRIENVPEAQRTAKIVFHQAARLVWLGIVSTKLQKVGQRYRFFFT